MLWPNLLQTSSLSNNWCWKLGLILDSLVYNTFIRSTFCTSILVVIIGRMLCSTMCSLLVWYTTSIVKACSSGSYVYTIVFAYCGNTYSNFIDVQVFIPFFMVLSVLRWNRLPNKTSIYGSCFHTSLCFLIHMWYFFRSIQSAMSLGWQTHLYFFRFPSLQDNPGCIISPSFWFNFRRLCLHWQPCLDIRLPHCSTNECFSRFHNYCRQCLISCKQLLCLGYSWHDILYSLWNMNYIASFANGSSPSTTFSSSFCCMATWSNYLCKLRVTTQFMFVPILLLFLGFYFCHIFKSSEQLFVQI